MVVPATVITAAVVGTVGVEATQSVVKNTHVDPIVAVQI